MPIPGGIDERTVAGLWERQAFDMGALSHHGLRVLFRGSPSDAGGPDYQDAMLIRGERELLTGDVEFHVRSLDWYRHGHHKDARYDGVILHVVWLHDGKPTTRHDGIAVPVLELSVGARTAVSPVANPLAGHPCIPAYRHMGTDQLLAIIRDLGRARFVQRAELFAADLSIAEPDQVLYTGILEACGYASNRSAFRALADVVPLNWLMSLPETARLPTLLDAAGLGPSSSYEPPGRLPASSWRLVRLRPANHPVRRIAGVVALLERHAPSPSSAMTQLVLDGPTPQALRNSICVPDEGGLLGAGRADEIVVSVVLPFVAALGHMERSSDLFERYPAPPFNRWTRRVLGMLAAAGHRVRVRRATEHQGVHSLYHTYCRLESRTGCPICGRGAHT